MPTINGKACVANGRNLIIQSDLIAGYIDRDNGNTLPWGDTDVKSDNYIPTNGATVFTFSSPDYAFKGNWLHTLAMYDSNKNYLGYQPITSATQTLSKSNVAYIKFSINFKEEGGTAGQLSDWLSAHRYKLEKGSVATPLTPAPVDKVFSNGQQVYGRNLLAGIDKTVHQAPGWFQWITNVPTKFIKVGQPLCLSAFINNAPYAGSLIQNDAFCLIRALDLSGDVLSEKTGNAINFDADGVSQASLIVPDKATDVLLFIVHYMKQNPYYGYPKLEFGSIATPWTPAPEDVM